MGVGVGAREPEERSAAKDEFEGTEAGAMAVGVGCGGSGRAALRVPREETAEEPEVAERRELPVRVAVQLLVLVLAGVWAVVGGQDGGWICRSLATIAEAILAGWGGGSGGGGRRKVAEE